MKGKGIFAALVATLLLGSVFSVSATDAASLGANWPNAPDVSRSVYHHVYRWQRQGVTYVQVNGANGQPQMALAYSQSGHLVLPVGEPDRVSVDLTATESPAGGTEIFDDGQVAVVETAGGFSVVNSPASASRAQALDASQCNGDPLECTRAN